MNRIVIWCMTALICLGIGSSYLLDGPSEFDAAIATSAAAHDVERIDLRLAAMVAEEK